MLVATLSQFCDEWTLINVHCRILQIEIECGIYWASVDSLSRRELLSDSLSSLGFAPPKIFVCCKPSANWLTGSLTVLGKSFNFGLAAASSAKFYESNKIIYKQNTLLI